jgi:hypothetical protein
MKTIRFLIVVVLLASCQQQVLKHKNSTDSLAPYLLSRIEGFSLPFSNDFSDSNTLFFGCLPAFDTSFFIHLHKEGKVIRAVLYEVPPTDRNAIEKLADGQQEQLSFKGYSFKIDSLQWISLINKADIIIDKSSIIKKESTCVDGTSYYFSYSKNIVMGRNCNDSILEGFSQYIKNIFRERLHK